MARQTGRLQLPAESVAGTALALMEGLEGFFDEVDAFYKDLHQHPELYGHEERTAARVAEQLQQAGFAVTPNVGGHGVVGVLANGAGPTVALRGDMDALPVEEKTGLPYASKERFEGTPVMHACGHDVHTSCLVGAARLLASTRERWKGTLVIVAQPAEESAAGARAMLQDGLFTRFPRPDIMLGQHVSPLPVGTYAHSPGTVMAGARSMRVRIFGKGGHGSTPHATVDPVVLAASIVLRLQTVVAREIDPRKSAVLTVGVLRAGTRANVIPDEAELELSLRFADDTTEKHLVEAVERIVRAECEASRAPRAPEISTLSRAPTTVNDEGATARVASVHEACFGKQAIIHLDQPVTGTEDFSLYARPGPDTYEGPAVPTCFWFLGSTAPERWKAAGGDDLFDTLARLPTNHSPYFAPDRVPTLRGGIEALTGAALAWLAAREA
ncbi:amidohydrolase [Pyxidicoccus sp. 3LG]